MSEATNLPTTESDSPPEEFSMSEADFYNEVYARHRTENHRALSAENRFWMAQYADSVKGTTMKPFVFPLFQWQHLTTNDHVRSLPETIQEMVVIELFFQNRYFGSRNRAKRDFASVQSLLQSWNAFVKNVAKSGFSHVVLMMLRSKMRFYKLTLKGRKMNVHDLSRNEGRPCAVLASQRCPLCFDNALKMDPATRAGLNPSSKISNTLRQAIARLDRDLAQHANVESDVEMLSDSDTDVHRDSEAEPDAEPMVVQAESIPAPPPPPRYVPAATATMKGIFSGLSSARLPASSPSPASSPPAASSHLSALSPPPVPSPQPASLHPPASSRSVAPSPQRNRSFTQAQRRDLERRLNEEVIARLELERRVVEMNIHLTRLAASYSELEYRLNSVLRSQEGDGSVRSATRRS